MAKLLNIWPNQNCRYDQGHHGHDGSDLHEQPQHTDRSGVQQHSLGCDDSQNKTRPGFLHYQGNRAVPFILTLFLSILKVYSDIVEADM